MMRAALAAALLCSSVARADSYNWTDLVASGDWDAVSTPPLNAIPGNWYDNSTAAFSSVVPGSADDVTFGEALYGPLGVTMDGPHSVNSLTFDTPQSFTISNSGGLSTMLAITSGRLIQTANDTGTQTISVPIALGKVGSWSLDGTGTVVVTQPVSSNGEVLGLMTAGTGNLTLEGQNTYKGETLISGTGTVLLTGSIGAAINGASPSNVVVNSKQGANFVLASSASDASNLITNTTVVAKTDQGTFTQNGGSHITEELAIGYLAGANGAYSLKEGSITVTTHSTIIGGNSSTNFSGAGAEGVFNQTGGIHQTPQLEIGSSSGATGTYNLSAGVLSVSEATFIGEANGSSGLFTQTGGQHLTQAVVLGVSIQVPTDPIIPGGWNRISNTNLDGQLPLQMAAPAVLQPDAQPPVTARYVLSGGTLTTEAIEGLSSGTELDLNGGTLQPTTNLTTFISGLDSAVVQAGGAVIDTNGFSVTIPQSLSHDSSLGATPDGGLTKNGNGTLTLTGSANYTGPTVVNGGSLVMPAISGPLSSSSYTSNFGATLRFNGGNLTSGGSITDNGTVVTEQFQSNGTISIAGGVNAATFYNANTNLVLAAGSHTYVGTASTPGGHLTMQNNATVQLQGTLVNNGDITGVVGVYSGGLISGGGEADQINVFSQGTLHAGNGIGSIQATDATLAGGAIFQFEINSATGTAGTNWSLLAIDDQLKISDLQGVNPPIVELFTVAGQGDTPTALPDFNPNQSYSWDFVSFGRYTSDDGDHPFQIDATHFENDTNGGTFFTTFSDGSLSLNYTPIPEPTCGLLGIASLTILRRRRPHQA